MNTIDIPKSVAVTGTHFDDTYTSTKSPQESTWSWYPPGTRKETWPHVTVGDRDDIADTVQVTDFLKGTSSFTKTWWYKLHVSVPLGGRNVSMWYIITKDWRVRPNGSNINQMDSSRKASAQAHVDRQSTDYCVFAQAFVDAARAAYIAGVVARGAPTTTNVGPQTPGAFNDGSRL